MGGKPSVCSLNKKEIEEFVKATYCKDVFIFDIVNEKEISQLFEIYKKTAVLHEDDGIIDKV